MDQLPYYLGFSYFLGIGPTKFDLLMKHFGIPKEAYCAKSELLKRILGVVTASKFIEFRNSFDPEKELKRIEQKRITVLTREHPCFPGQLRNISDTPICLYIKGDVRQFDFTKQKFFGVVGTRRPTTYGAMLTRKFSRELAEAGFVIVSGMAMGIDTLAHLTALESGSQTIAFLGCGVNIIYPSINSDLYHRIIEHGGLVISEFPPDMTVLKGLFVARNRLISGLSQGVLVAEGLKGSGSLITARYALEQGKDVFAPPAPITSDQSQAPNSLLKEGAKLVTCVDDILEEYNMSFKSAIKEQNIDLLPEEHGIIDVLKQESLEGDELARALQKPIHDILPVLSTLELKGIIIKGEDGKYQLII